MIHLADYSRYHDHETVPLAVTQEGIASGVGINVSHVPRAVKRLKSEGSILERKTHVRGAARRRKSYFLTMEGQTRARELTSQLLEETVPVRKSDGTVAEMTIAQLCERLPGTAKPLTLLVAAAKSGWVDLETSKVADTGTKESMGAEQQFLDGFEERIQARAAEEPIETYRSTDQVWSICTNCALETGRVFIDRRTALETLTQVYRKAGDQPQCVTVRGPQGVGKKRLIRHFIESGSEADPRHALWFRGDATDTDAATTIGALTSVIAAGCQPRFSCTKLASTAEVASFIHRSLSTADPPIGIGVLEMVPISILHDPAFVHVFERLAHLARAQHDPFMVVVIIQCEPAQADAPSEPLGLDGYEQTKIVLDPFDADACSALARALAPERDWSPALIDRWYHYSNGYPGRFSALVEAALARPLGPDTPLSADEAAMLDLLRTLKNQ